MLKNAFVYFLAAMIFVVSFFAMPVFAVAEFASNAPAVSVTPGQKNVLVMDFTLPAFTTSADIVIDADGIATAASGTSSMKSGDALFSITAAKKLYINDNNDPKYLWVDSDGSKKFTYIDSIEVSEEQYTPEELEELFANQQTEVFWQTEGGFHPDLGAPLTVMNDAGLRIVKSDNSPTAWSERRDALFYDNGTVPDLLDAGDTRLSVTDSGKRVAVGQYSAALQKTIMILRRDDGLCPEGIAVGDTIQFQRNNKTVNNTLIQDVIYESAYGVDDVCLATINIQFEYDLGVSPVMQTKAEDFFNDATTATAITANNNGGIPNNETTTITVATGDLQGMAVGDTVRFTEGENTIDFRVISLNTTSKQMGVNFVASQGTLQSNDPVTTAIQNSVDINGLATAKFLLPADFNPLLLTFIDENGNGERDDGELIYWDENDPNARIVSFLKDAGEDVRITGLKFEKPLYVKNDVKFDLLEPQENGVAVVTNAMNSPKIYSQTADWKEGDDLVIDVDGDGLYSADKLTAIEVINKGTVSADSVSMVRLWLESNNQAGHQSSDSMLAILTEGDLPGLWQADGLSQVLAGEARFYLTVDLAQNAMAGGTLQFAIRANSFTTANRVLPSELVTNEDVQTLSGVASVNDENDFEDHDGDDLCSGFSDVKNNSKYCDAIIWAKENNVVQGYTDGTFGPDKAINRVEMLKVILEALKVSIDDYDAVADAKLGFSDVFSDQWYMPYVKTGKKFTVFVGDAGKGTARPGDTVNRVEALKLSFETMRVASGFQLQSCAEPAYLDSVAGQWYQDYVCQAKEHSLFDLTDATKVEPGKLSTRGEVVLMLYRLHEVGLITAS